MFLVIIGKVFYIQVIDYKKLNNYETSLWSRNLTLVANRGVIYVTNGVELAISSRPDFSASEYQNYTVEQINRNLPIKMIYEAGSTFKKVNTI